MPRQEFDTLDREAGKRKYYDFLWASILTAVLMSIIALVADSVIPEGRIALWSIFTIQGTSLKYAIYILCAGLMVAVILAELGRFTSDIGELFGRTINRIIERVDNLGEQVREGVFRYGAVLYRVLRYDENNGVIYNRLDEKANSEVRNIVFDARTVNAILRALKPIELGQSNLEQSQLLLNLGKAAGSNFGKRFMDHVQSNAPPGFKIDDLYDWLEYWIRYDTQAGFGRFLVPPRSDWPRSMSVTLRHSFLTPTVPGGPSDAARLCDFMTGYIEGFLKQLPEDALERYSVSGSTLTVTHPDDSVHCAHYSRNNERGCIFILRGQVPQQS
jgi:hypothetical protein